MTLLKIKVDEKSFIKTSCVSTPQYKPKKADASF